LLTFLNKDVTDLRSTCKETKILWSKIERVEITPKLSLWDISLCFYDFLVHKILLAATFSIKQRKMHLALYLLMRLMQWEDNVDEGGLQEGTMNVKTH